MTVTSEKVMAERPVTRRNARSIANKTQMWMIGLSPRLAALWSSVLQHLGAAPSSQTSKAAPDLAIRKSQIAPIIHTIEQSRSALGTQDTSTIIAHAQLNFVINHAHRKGISDRRQLTAMSPRIGVIICVDRPGEPDRAEPPHWRSLQWLQALLSIELATRNLPRAFVTADALRDDWRFVVGRLAKILQVTWPRYSDFAAVEIDRLIGLERGTLPPSTGIPGIPIVEQAQKVFQTMVLSADGKSQHAAIDRIREQYNVIAANVGPIYDSFLKASGNGDELSQRNADIARLIQRLADARAKALEYATRFRHAGAPPAKSKAK